jgi:hypothetical protein
LVVAILSEVYIAIQAHNEKAWERFITRMWIDNISKSDIFTIITNFVLSKYNRTAPAENSQKFIKYEDDELAEIALQYRTTLSPPDGVLEKLTAVQAQLDLMQKELARKTNDL